jgi:hypothetical protein
MKITSSQFFDVPHARPGGWAFWLMVAFVVMFIINSVVFMRMSGNAPWR